VIQQTKNVKNVMLLARPVSNKHKNMMNVFGVQMVMNVLME